MHMKYFWEKQKTHSYFSSQIPRGAVLVLSPSSKIWLRFIIYSFLFTQNRQEDCGAAWSWMVFVGSGPPFSIHSTIICDLTAHTVTWGWSPHGDGAPTGGLPTAFCSLSWATLGSHVNSEMIKMSPASPRLCESSAVNPVAWLLWNSWWLLWKWKKKQRQQPQQTSTRLPGILLLKWCKTGRREAGPFSGVT